MRSVKCGVWSVKCDFVSDFGCLQTTKPGKCNFCVLASTSGFESSFCIAWGSACVVSGLPGCVRIVHIPAAVVWVVHANKSIRWEHDHISQACNIAIIYNVLREQVSTNITHVYTIQPCNCVDSQRVRATFWSAEAWVYVRRCGPRRLAPWNRRCSKTFFVSCRKKSLCWRLCAPRIWKHACGQGQAPEDTKQMKSEPSITEFTIRLKSK